MTRRAARPANDIAATDSPELLRLFRRAGQLEAVRARLARDLPVAMREHLKVANIRDGALVLAVDSPAWATRVRYQSREILQTGSQICKTQLSEVVVRVIPELFYAPEAKMPRTDGDGHLDRLAKSLGLDRS